MMAKLAKCLNESNINVILTQSASMTNLTAALKNLRVEIFALRIVSHSNARFHLGKESSTLR